MLDLPIIIQSIVYEDIDATMRVYLQVTEKMKKDASEKIINLFRNILENSYINKCFFITFLRKGDFIQAKKTVTPMVDELFYIMPGIREPVK